MNSTDFINMAGRLNGIQTKLRLEEVVDNVHIDALNALIGALERLAVDHRRDEEGQRIAEQNARFTG